MMGDYAMPSQDIDSYLAAFDEPMRTTLEKLRRSIPVSLATVMGPGGCHEEGTTCGHE